MENTMELAEALYTKIPVINVVSDDPVHELSVLKDYAHDKNLILPMQKKADWNGLQPALSKMKEDATKTGNGSLLVVEYGDDLKWTEMYTPAQTTHSVIVVVSRPADDVQSLVGVNCGYLKPLDTSYARALRELKYPAQTIDALIPCLRGLNIQQAKVVASVAQARGDISPQALQSGRYMLLGSVAGLSIVPPSTQVYIVDAQLQAWLGHRAAAFVQAKPEDIDMVPRGILLGGTPGTGKTQAAHYIASQLGTVLLRLDLSSMMTRWLGEAESNLDRALSMIEMAAPCTVLVDEIEKVFNGTDNDSLQRMLGRLLWWLQEHRHRIFMVMTCNDKGKLPPELYREGRIDGEIPLMGIQNAQELDYFVGIIIGSYAQRGFNTQGIGFMVEQFPIAQAKVVANIREQVIKLNYQTGS
jgi:hypothetical protein